MSTQIEETNVCKWKSRLCLSSGTEQKNVQKLLVALYDEYGQLFSDVTFKNMIIWKLSCCWESSSISGTVWSRTS